MMTAKNEMTTLYHEKTKSATINIKTLRQSNISYHDHAFRADTMGFILRFGKRSMR